MGKQKHRFKFGRLKVLMLAVAGVNLLITGVNHQSAMSAQLDRQEELMAEQRVLQHQLEYHEHELDFIGTDEYIEQEARNRLGWVRSNEVMYVDSSSSEPPHEKVSVEPTATPSVPGPRRTERPAAASAGSSASASPRAADDDDNKKTPEPSPSTAPEGSAQPSGSPERTPHPSSTPKSIG